MKYMTMDCEGDGLHRSINQKLFPNANHFDKNTTIWCVTFAVGEHCVTFFKKLPDKEHRRNVILDDGKVWGTVNSYHEAESKPYDYSALTDFRDFTDKSYEEYLQAIADFLRAAHDRRYRIYYKSYNGYKYDEDLLRVNFDKYNIDITHCFDYMYSCEAWMPKTTEQQSLGTYTPNEVFMNKGIKHNIEDAKELYKRTI